MERILKDIAKIINFSDSFFEEVESLGKLGFFEADMVTGCFKASTNYKKLFHLPESTSYELDRHLDLVHPDDIVRVLETFISCLKEKKNFETNYRVIVQGEVRYFREQSVIIFNDLKKPVKVVGMKQDVTTEKKAELERIRYIRKLEQACEDTSTIVHDLKAPIHNLSMIGELLKGNVVEEKEVLIEVLEESCRRSYEIIENMLENNLLDEEGIKREKENCNLHVLVSQAVSTICYSAKKKNIEIQIDLQPDTFACVYPTELKRAIENLLSNAVKFSYRNSKIKVSLYEKSGGFVIKVADFGLGMNEFQVERLFGEDRAARRKGTGGEKSFGLGLNIVKKIMNQHAGTIKVESEEAVGTNFYLELPA